MPAARWAASQRIRRRLMIDASTPCATWSFALCTSVRNDTQLKLPQVASDRSASSRRQN